MKRLALVLLLFACVAVAALAQAPTPGPTPTPAGALIRYSGQLLDVQKGFAVFSTGDAFRLAPNVRIVDAHTGGAPAKPPTTRTYARATFDQSSGTIVELAVADQPLPLERQYADVKSFAVAQSAPVANPDLAPQPLANQPGTFRIPLTGKLVDVRFVVRVPPTTRQDDTVYMATDSSGWNATAQRLDRVDGLHYAVTLPLRTGTRFAYKYTRGSWRSVERGRTGLDDDPHPFFLGASTDREPDVQRHNDVVETWSDDNPANPGVGPDSIPTPFNPRIFGYPTGAPTAAPAGSSPPRTPSTPLPRKTG